MARIKDYLLIKRPIKVVFDYAADQRQEPSYNPAMVKCTKATPGPIGVGTRFDSALRRRGGEVAMSSEVLAFDRPHSVTTRTTVGATVVTGTLSFVSESPTSTRMAWDWQVRPTGWMRVLEPIIAPIGRRFERRIWTGLRDRLESNDEDSV